MTTLNTNTESAYRMQITKLDHVNLRTAQLEKVVAWYEDLLSLREGFRPNFPFPGAWLYAGDAAVIHLTGVDATAGAGSEQDLKLEHFAFRAEGAEAFETKLKERGETYECNRVDETGTIAFNIWDPDGNHIHVDFDIRKQP